MFEEDAHCAKVIILQAKWTDLRILLDCTFSESSLSRETHLVFGSNRQGLQTSTPVKDKGLFCWPSASDLSIQNYLKAEVIITLSGVSSASY